jgi:tyrosyl-tRNA synthetase
MNVSIALDISHRLPGYHIGVAVISDLTNSGIIKSKPEIQPSAQLQIAAWEKAAALMGINPKQFPQANANLHSRFSQKKQLPRVNPIVDLANIFSLETGLPIGIHDLDHITRDIEIRPGQENDSYQSLNQKSRETITDPLVYTFGHTIMTRNWTWRLSDTTKVTSATKNIIIFVDALPPQLPESTLNTTQTLAEKLVKKFGGQIQFTGLLTSAFNQIAFNHQHVEKKSSDQIDEFLTRGVANIIPGKSELEKILHSDTKLNIYLGIDPTSVNIHLGHAFPLRKLQTLVDLGHHVTFLIGDFTALIGDTSDKDTERPVLTYEQIEANFQTYKTQASKILDFSRVKVVHNSEWLKNLTFEDVVKLTRHFTLNDFISRELIRKRLDDGRSVSLPEVLYPVMQGYDSWYMDTDLQLGGTDQTFNMQAGRTLQKDLRHKESFVLSTGFLEGTDGRKMSKSWGNAIWLTDEPNDMYGKVMRLKDDLIIQYFTLATNISTPEIEKLKSRLNSGENPMNLKKELALTIVTELYDHNRAISAQDFFVTSVQQQQIPQYVPTMTITNHNSNIIDVLVETKLAKSNSDARRLIDQGGVKLDGQRVSDYKQEVHSGQVLSSGSHKHIKII